MTPGPKKSRSPFSSADLAKETMLSMQGRRASKEAIGAYVSLYARHKIQAHSADAVPTEARSTTTTRASCIIACPPWSRCSRPPSTHSVSQLREPRGDLAHAVEISRWGVQSPVALQILPLNSVTQAPTRPQNFLSNNSFVSLSKVGAEDRDARRGTTKARMASAKASSSA